MHVLRLRPPGARTRPTPWSVGVPVVVALTGFLLVTSATTSHGTDLRADRRTDLAQLITDQQQRVAAQQRAVSGLQRQLTAAGAGVTNPQLERQRAAAAARRPAAGLTSVSGPGLTVALDDAPYSPNDPRYAGVPPDYLVVHQQDVQGVVNALWAGGATAMTIMGHRVISTTAVRCVGNTLLLAGQPPYSPPFRIAAVGDPTRLRAALVAAPEVRIYLQYVDAYGLGWSVHAADRLTLPAYDGPLTLSYARPAG